MIDFIKIKNIALIDEVELHMDTGLTILSGETGAGKSILIDSMNVVLGSRASKDFVRKQATFAQIEMLVSVVDTGILENLQTIGIDIDGREALLLSRQINKNGKTVAKINNQVSTMATLKEVGEFLVDIHGQHEHQSLLHRQKHRELLDRFLRGAIDDDQINLITLLKEKRSLLAEKEALETDSLLEMDMFTFQLEEIDGANIETGEEAALEIKRKQLLQRDEIENAQQATHHLLFGSGGVKENLKTAISHMQALLLIEETLSPSYDLLMDMEANLEEVSYALDVFESTLPAAHEDINKVEKRLHTFFLLKRKYKKTLEGLIEYREVIREKIFNFSKREEVIAKLAEKIQKLTEEIMVIAEKITQKRTKAAEKIEKRILSELADLGMEDAKFQVELQLQKVDKTGQDRIEFLISTNKGEALKPLVQVASGGEMSRVMLALKMVLSDFDTIETFIFDEIDAGVSGKAAQKVAEKLAILSRKRQVLCITHLPQIAAMGDHHFLIEKKSDAHNTITQVFPLDTAGMVEEIARLTSGQAITAASLFAAEELKKLANDFKKQDR